MPDPFTPSLTVLVKLGSIMVHAEEMTDLLGHGFDKIALQGLLEDPEVQEWRESMAKLALLPVKRVET